ncbi:unnamed protein product [Eruca vesicaria subsp. sativa]|uniref:Glutaredoxin domain-containing protein n=1 Tax=Eruca vesicaria subsp. sativa TaxID=29727 RepID=A0ABC8LM73_ERUVS|nr:unnamed protein product [Eruca vesicaria subsp. sativa]
MMFSNWLHLRRRLKEISPGTPPRSRRFSCSSFKDIHHLLSEDESSPEPYSPRLQVLHKSRSLKIDRCTWRTPPSTTETLFSNTDHGAVVLYYTSLGAIRKTSKECKAVRKILHELRIPVDERDLVMDSRFLDELHAIFGTRNVELPKVFIGGRYIGGAEEVTKLHESDELRKMVGELPQPEGRYGEICDMCGGCRFVVCETCNGSHKIFSEKNGFICCTVCDVKGIVRCSSCFPMHRRRYSDIYLR